MMFLMWSSELPRPSGPRASWAGQAIFLSATMTGPGSRRSMHCSMMRRDWRISSRRMRKRP
ncbi:hypothetical protein EES46_06455 [Streptomyces sp. ADI98-10]|nr:hypothetical protein EES46_06455 [Streptomyces sp. ADI98-10]